MLPGPVASAQAGAGSFAGRDDPAFDAICELFSDPSLPWTSVTNAVTGGEWIRCHAMAGHTILFGATEGIFYLDGFGPEAEVSDAKRPNAAAALTTVHNDGSGTAGLWPPPNVILAAATVLVTILSISGSKAEATGRTRV